MTDDADRQIAALTPNDSASLARFREVVGGGVDVIIGRSLPPREALEYRGDREGCRSRITPEHAALLRNKPEGKRFRS